ncbi:MAG: type I-C CRISPR-associated protein Cas8c/Csd1 [Pseudomonadota bacterium]|nr:type I-C CRISPR-associated protein Cas8c/Csd1 [Pseudomonadota bacterium]
MILQLLNDQYERLLARGEPGLSPFGYSQEKISYCVVLSAAGEPLQAIPLLDTSGKKPLPRSLSVPQPKKRASDISPSFLWDKTSYVLGVSLSSKRSNKEHEAFKQLHLEMLGHEADEGLQALCRFLNAWTPERFDATPFHADMMDTNVVFRLDGDPGFLHERPAARAVRARLLASDGIADAASQVMCLITGEVAPTARLHPAIKGVNGAQSSGASIVSFNQESFNSWSKVQGDNAPVSEQAAFAYTTMLNHLLRRDERNRQRFSVGDTTVVFWAETPDSEEAEAAESLFSSMFMSDLPDTDEQATAKLARAIEMIAHGAPLQDIDPKLQPGTRMVVLGLAPNASRLSIRFVLHDTLALFTARLRRHALDLALEPTPWKKPPSPWRLALITAPSRDGKHKSDDVSPRLAGDLMRAILTGQRYPQSVLSSLVMRFRNDGDISGLRVALCKAVLNRDARLSSSHSTGASFPKEISMSFDPQDAHPAYLLGRLFATLENAQRAALGGSVNATIRDRYFGAASATPALVFPVLLRNVQNHLARLRKDKPGIAVNLEKDLREIVGMLPTHFPKSLALQDQGRFAIGYYHQSEARFRKPDKDSDAPDAEAA